MSPQPSPTSLYLLDQLLGGIFSCKSNKCKSLGLIILHLVNRPDHLYNRAKLLKVSLQVLLGESLASG